MVTVNVWNYSRLAVLTKSGNVGHASMQIGSEYVSWWPTEPVASFEEDVHLEGRQPDHVFYLKGLDESGMSQWWHVFKDSHEYEFIGMNCSTVVGHCLLEGGAAGKASLGGRLWHSWNFIWDPDDVRRLAASLA